MVAVDIDLCFFCFFQTEVRWTRHLFFSRMRSEGFSFYLWGSGGGGVFARRRVFMFATVRNRSQPFATIRRRDRVAESYRTLGEKLQKALFLCVSSVT